MSPENLSDHGIESSVPVYDGWDDEDRIDAFERAQAGEDLWVVLPILSEMTDIFWRFRSGKRVAIVHGSGSGDTLHYALLMDGNEAELLNKQEAIKWVDEHLESEEHTT